MTDHTPEKAQKIGVKLYACAADECPHACESDRMIWFAGAQPPPIHQPYVKAGWYCEDCFGELDIYPIGMDIYMETPDIYPHIKPAPVFYSCAVDRCAEETSHAAAYLHWCDGNGCPGGPGWYCAECQVVNNCCIDNPEILEDFLQSRKSEAP